MALGLSLAELSRILAIRDRGGAPCRQVQALALEKLAGLDGRIEDLMALRGQMPKLVAEWETRLDVTPDGQPARLLKTLMIPPSRENESK